MIPQSWVETQVFSMNVKELKHALGRQRLRLDRAQIVAYLMALMSQQLLLRHYKFVHSQASCGVGYAGFMKGLELVAPLWSVLEKRFREQNHIVFDLQTIVDSSLLPSKEDKSITQKDWNCGFATARKSKSKSLTPEKTYICGEKVLTFINSKHQIVFSQLMPSINSSDENVFKHPMVWASRGLRNGVLLVDRAFSNKSARQGIDFLNKNLSGYCLKIISPPKHKQIWVLSAEEKALYQKRWAIEEVFRQLKDPFGLYRMILKGVRRKGLREARVAIATLAWNWRLSNP